MTQETYNYLKRFEKNFKTAAEAGYTRNISSKDHKRLRDIYEKETKKKFTCDRCGIVDLLLELKPIFDSFNPSPDKEDQQIKTKPKKAKKKEGENEGGKE